MYLFYLFMLLFDSSQTKWGPSTRSIIISQVFSSFKSNYDYKYNLKPHILVKKKKKKHHTPFSSIL